MADESETDRIRKQMAVQRAALGDKLDILEHKIVGTVQAANDAVRDTVRDAKNGVEATVQSVRDSVHASVAGVHETLDVSAQVDRHPWGMFAASIAAGFAAGWLLNRANGRSHGSGISGVALPTQGASLIDNLSHTFAPEIQQLKSLAIGAAIAIVRDKVSDALPEAMRAQVAGMMDNVATKVGGAADQLPVERS